MSLINEMLADLDERKAASPVAGDLLSDLRVASVPGRTRPLPPRPLLLFSLSMAGLAFLALLALTIRAPTWGSLAVALAGPNIDRDTVIAPRRLARRETDSSLPTSSAGPNQAASELAPGGSDLYAFLDRSPDPVPASSPVRIHPVPIARPALTAAAAGAILERVELANQAREAALVLGFDHAPAYVVYTVADPPHAVIELEGTRVEAMLPGVESSNALVKGIRTSVDPSGKLRVILDLNHEADIESSELADDAQGFALVTYLETAGDASGVSSEAAAGAPAGEGAPASGVLTASPVRKTATNAASPIDEQVLDAAELAGRGDLGEAASLLRAVLARDPQHLQARIWLARTLLQGGDRSGAGRVLEAGLAGGIRDPGLAKLYARIRVDEGDIGSALRALNDVKPDLESDPEYHAFLAALLERSGRHAEAVLVYRSVVEEQPENGVWWLGLAISLEASGEIGEAANAYQTAMATGALDASLRRFAEERLAGLDS